MALSRTTNPEHRRPHPDDPEEIFAPRHELREESIAAAIAHDLITSELLLDGSARLNLATFVTTWMPGPAARLMAETADKNMIDKDEYPQTADIEARCVNIIAALWNAPESGDASATGCSTTGSSEAAMLGGLALKWRWRERMTRGGQAQ